MTSTSCSAGSKCKLPRSGGSFISVVNARHGFSSPQFLSIPLSSTPNHKFPAGFTLKSLTYRQHRATSKITNSNALLKEEEEEEEEDDDGDGCRSTQFITHDPPVRSGVYSIDLIGYGYSDKPNPRDFGDTSFYTIQTWASQLNDFCMEHDSPNVIVPKCVVGLVGLQAAVMAPHLCKGLVLLNVSLRMLHIKKQPPLARPLLKSFQSLLRNTALGKLFFRSVATPQSVRNILCQCYHDTSQVTDELVEKILRPGLEPGAADVFLEFVCYSDGPLPEELLPQVKCPVLIAWGDKDPWEPIELGRAYGNFETVEDFVVLPDVGHCPQDEAPHLVNPLVESFVASHSAMKASMASESLV
ncbi:hypothetical protein Cgig2_016894 [Carnegiea gigantea]|uniref:AB hydrolase-1 domain-containing protein n=1 Tax=Carnegiea gigantea TaxID=171969 RepID=A0A9Q1K676_9CARY|nr:hypothetical protein Cgig2_016894 [Carnegiea gigantea]